MLFHFVGGDPVIDCNPVIDCDEECIFYKCFLRVISGFIWVLVSDMSNNNNNK